MTKYLNVDLELESKANLSPLAEYFSERALVLFNGRVGRRHRLVIEIHDAPSRRSSHAADQCIQSLIELITPLPVPLRDLWDACTARVFDIGFESGVCPRPYEEHLSEQTITLVASFGGAVRLSLYPVDPSDD
jgi:hypothetical protein